MTRKILFPGSAWKHFDPATRADYYNTHYLHIKNYLSYVGDIVVLDKNTTIESDDHHNNFVVQIDDKRVIFDYSDFDYATMNIDDLNQNMRYFKIHTTLQSDHRCIPFPPMSFMDWSIYTNMKPTVKYDPNGSIFYKCRPYGAAVERRIGVMAMLLSYNGIPVDYEFVPQINYFSSFNKCRINVIVPGARLDILDRTHMQSFAFGIPVITPKITTILPYGESFNPGLDYIECKPDFSDVIELIERYKDDKEYLDFISNNCKNKFANTCTPEKVAEWIIRAIS